MSDRRMQLERIAFYEDTYGYDLEEMRNSSMFERERERKFTSPPFSPMEKKEVEEDVEEEIRKSGCKQNYDIDVKARDQLRRREMEE